MISSHQLRVIAFFALCLPMTLSPMQPAALDLNDDTKTFSSIKVATPIPEVPAKQKSKKFGPYLGYGFGAWVLGNCISGIAAGIYANNSNLAWWDAYDKVQSIATPITATAVLLVLNAVHKNQEPEKRREIQAKKAAPAAEPARSPESIDPVAFALVASYSMILSIAAYVMLS